VILREKKKKDEITKETKRAFPEPTAIKNKFAKMYSSSPHLS